MRTPEVPNECIDHRIETIEQTTKRLEKIDEAVSPRETLERLAAMEEKPPETLIERMREVMLSHREAKKKGEPFMANYTREVRAEAEKLHLDPSKYAALRTKLDLNLRTLG